MVTRREAQPEAANSAAASPLALAVWDLLTNAYRQRQGALTVTALMRSGELGRSEVQFGLSELARAGWATRRVVEVGGKLVEVWAVERDRGHDRDGVAAE
jgi:hypothetical protein